MLRSNVVGAASRAALRVQKSWSINSSIKLLALAEQRGRHEVLTQQGDVQQGDVRQPTAHSSQEFLRRQIVQWKRFPAG